MNKKLLNLILVGLFLSWVFILSPSTVKADFQSDCIDRQFREVGRCLWNGIFGLPPVELPTISIPNPIQGARDFFGNIINPPPAPTPRPPLNLTPTSGTPTDDADPASAVAPAPATVAAPATVTPPQPHHLLLLLLNLPQPLSLPRNLLLLPIPLLLLNPLQQLQNLKK